MEALCDLMFELSNEDRLKILYELEKEELRLSHISKKLDFTVQETSRNVARLVEAKLIERNADSNYILTSFGETALNILGPYHFLSKHQEYILKHRITNISRRFLTRIGELNNCNKVTHLMEAFALVEKMLKETEEYYLFIAKESLVSAPGIIHARDALDNGSKGKGIELEGFKPSKKIMESIPEKVLMDMHRHRIKGNLKNRFLERIDFALFMNEKEVVFDFPGLDGEFDFLGFTSTDHDTLDWCKNVFDYYWERAK